MNIHPVVQWERGILAPISDLQFIHRQHTRPPIYTRHNISQQKQGVAWVFSAKGAICNLINESTHTVSKRVLVGEPQDERTLNGDE
jgi:hypothetical protein